MVFEGVAEYSTSTLDGISSIFYDYYLGWVLTTLFCTVVFPVLLFVMYGVSIVVLVFYTWYWGRIHATYGITPRNGAFNLLSTIWNIHSRLWHDYEVIGLEKIPRDGPAVLVLYHGALPLDFAYLQANYYLKYSRIMYAIVDNFLLKIPGYQTVADALNLTPGSVQKCANILKKGGLICIYPGGIYESQFGDSNYKLMWRNRLGFAKVALEAKVPIIPIFTQNIREAIVSLPIGRDFWMKLFMRTRLPVVPLLGDFPVKLRTFIGDPIPYEPMSPEELKLKVAAAIDKLIEEHQRLPGSIFQALLDRFRSVKNNT